ncbi:MAG TPA: hypothetical protein VGX70_08745, partial [Gemmataceae bacterium]|nr:hypothetical protein [Gemmataceae bacterium]
MSRVKADYIPTYRKHLTTGQAVVSLNGIDRYLGRYGTVASKQAYDRLVSEWLIGGRQLPDTGDLSIAGLILAYWNAVGKRLEGGRSDNLRAVLKIVKEAYGSALVPDFGPKALKVVREKMREKNWSRGFINTQIAWVKRIFRWGA